MSKITALKNSVRKNNPSSNGDKSEKLKDSKLMQKEQTKNDDMFFEKKIVDIQKEIKDKMDSFSNDINGIFTSLDITSQKLQKTPNAASFKQAAISISIGAYGFFTNSKELLNTLEKVYDQNNELLSEKEQTKLKSMIKSLSLIVSMSTAFYKASKKMISKIDLESPNYTQFEENLSSLLDTCKNVQSRIASNLSSYKFEKLQVEFLNGEKENLLFNNLNKIESLKNQYKSTNLSFYKVLKTSSSKLRDEKRKNDEELSKKIVKVNI